LVKKQKINASVLQPNSVETVQPRCCVGSSNSRTDREGLMHCTERLDEELGNVVVDAQRIEQRAIERRW
jgi:hypothetical protein